MSYFFFSFPFSIKAEFGWSHSVLRLCGSVFSKIKIMTDMKLSKVTKVNKAELRFNPKSDSQQSITFHYMLCLCIEAGGMMNNY